MWTQNHQSGRQTGGASAVADSGEGPGGPGPPLFLDQNEARKAEKNFFFEAAPPAYLRVLITAPPAPYLKVWICHCSAPIHCAESRMG